MESETLMTTTLPVLVVGATGSLGGKVVDELLNRGKSVRALVRSTTDASRLESRGVEIAAATRSTLTHSSPPCRGRMPSSPARPDTRAAARRRRHRHGRQRRRTAGERWQDIDLVFTTQMGTALYAANVRRSFRKVVAEAGLDASAWTPRELRHSFVSLLSSIGRPIE